MSVAGATPEAIGRELTANCEVVSQWMLGNKLKLNADKTHLITVGTSSRVRMGVFFKKALIRWKHFLVARLSQA